MRLFLTLHLLSSFSLKPLVTTCLASLTDYYHWGHREGLSDRKRLWASGAQARECALK